MTPCTRPLEDLRRGDEPAFGGKSAALGELLAAGIPVPAGFGISAAAFSAFMADSELSGFAQQALGRADVADVDSVGEASRSIVEAIRSAELPAAVRSEVQERYRALGGPGAAVPGTTAPVAVRSSAVGEDSGQATFAGQQDTYLWVRDVEAVCEAVRDCWASLYSVPAISYRARLGEAGPPAMGVTVQAMVDAEVSGVMFTCNPVSGDPSMVAINASWGLGLAVVGGEVTPDDFLVSKVTGEVVREHVHDKTIQYVPRPDGRGAHAVAVEPARREARCLDREALETLVSIARRVERHFGSHQDIEWAIARGMQPPENLFVLQSRPVTATGKTASKPKDPPASALSLVMKQFGVGTATGSGARTQGHG